MTLGQWLVVGFVVLLVVGCVLVVQAWWRANHTPE